MTSGGLFSFFFFLCFIIPTEEGLAHAVFVWERNFAFSSSLQLLFFKHITCFPIAYFMYQISFHCFRGRDKGESQRPFSFPPEWFVEQRPREDKDKMLYPMLRSFNKERSPFPGRVRCAKKKLFYKKHTPIHHSSHKQLLESHFIPPPPG